MSSPQVVGCIASLAFVSLLLTGPSSTNPIGLKGTSEDLKGLKARLDTSSRNNNGLKADMGSVSETGIATIPQRRRRTDSRGVMTRSLGLSAMSGLSSLVSRARSTVGGAVKAIVSPIDSGAKTAVGGVGLVMGAMNGLTAGIGSQAYNSLVKVHNTNMDNLGKLRSLVGKVGRSAVDLGTTAVSETANVLDTMRQEENRLLKKATDDVPVVRHLVSLRNVARLATKNGVDNLVKGAKMVGDLAVGAATFEKGEEVQGPSGGVGGFLQKIEGLSASELITVGLAMGSSNSNADTLKKIAETTSPESAVRIGEAIGRHKSSSGRN